MANALAYRVLPARMHHLAAVHFGYSSIFSVTPLILQMAMHTHAHAVEIIPHTAKILMIISSPYLLFEPLFYFPLRNFAMGN
jgi:hypothetical protein